MVNVFKNEVLVNSKKGFTLIELLVVIVIIGILALVGVSSYASSKRSFSLMIASDRFVNVVKGQRILAKSGKIDDAGHRKCYGVYIKDGMNEFFKVESDYVYVGKDGKESDSCDVNYVKDGVSFGGKIGVKGLFYNGGAVDGLFVLFKPPFGDGEVRVGGGIDIGVVKKVGAIRNSFDVNDLSFVGKDDDSSGDVTDEILKGVHIVSSDDNSVRVVVGFLDNGGSVDKAIFIDPITGVIKRL